MNKDYIRETFGDKRLSNLYVTKHCEMMPDGHAWVGVLGYLVPVINKTTGNVIQDVVPIVGVNERLGFLYWKMKYSDTQDT